MRESPRDAWRKALFSVIIGERKGQTGLPLSAGLKQEKASHAAERSGSLSAGLFIIGKA